MTNWTFYNFWDISYLFNTLFLSSYSLCSPLMETRQLTLKSSNGWPTSPRSAGRLKVEPFALFPVCIYVCVCVFGVKSVCVHPVTCWTAWPSPSQTFVTTLHVCWSKTRTRRRAHARNLRGSHMRGSHPLVCWCVLVNPHSLPLRWNLVRWNSG